MTPRAWPTAAMPERLGDDGDVALAAAVLDHQAAQARAVVVEQVGRAHGARDQHGVVRQIGDGAARARAAGQDAQQAVGQLVEVLAAARANRHRPGAACARGCRSARARPPPRRSCRAGSPPSCAAASRGRARTCGRLPAPRGARRWRPARPAPASRRWRPSAPRRRLPAGGSPRSGSLASSSVTTTRGSCSTTWPSARPSDSGWPRTTWPTARLNSAPVLTPATAPGHQMLGQHHGGRLQHLDVLVGIFLLRLVLDRQHAQHVAAAQDRHRQERVVDLLARLRPVGEGRMVLRVRLVDGHGQLGAAPDQALAALHEACCARRRD